MFYVSHFFMCLCTSATGIPECLIKRTNYAKWEILYLLLTLWVVRACRDMLISVCKLKFIETHIWWLYMKYFDCRYSCDLTWYGGELYLSELRMVPDVSEMLLFLDAWWTWEECN